MDILWFFKTITKKDAEHHYSELSAYSFLVRHNKFVLNSAPLII